MNPWRTCLTTRLSQGQETGKGISPSSDNVGCPSSSDFFDLLSWLLRERLENLIGEDVKFHGSCNLVETVGGVEIGTDIGGDNLDDTDIGVDQRVTEADEEGMDGGFGGAVDREDGHRNIGQSRGSDEEMSLSLDGLEVVGEVTGEDEGTDVVGVDLVDQLFIAEVLERLKVALVLDTGVDPDGVDIGIFGNQCLSILGEVGNVRVVEGEGVKAWEFLSESIKTILTTAGDDDFLSHAMEATGKGLTNATSAAEDEDGGEGIEGRHGDTARFEID